MVDAESKRIRDNQRLEKMNDNYNSNKNRYDEINLKNYNKNSGEKNSFIIK